MNILLLASSLGNAMRRVIQLSRSRRFLRLHRRARSHDSRHQGGFRHELRESVRRLDILSRRRGRRDRARHDDHGELAPAFAGDLRSRGRGAAGRVKQRRGNNVRSPARVRPARDFACSIPGHSSGWRGARRFREPIRFSSRDRRPVPS